MYYVVWDPNKPLFQVKRFVCGKIVADCTSEMAMLAAFRLLLEQA